MDLPNNRVTRRVALGSLAAGLAGVAWGLHAFRRTPVARMPQSDFENEWQKYVALLDVPIADCVTPPSAVSSASPQVDKKFQLHFLTANYDGVSDASSYPAPPDSYSFTIGSVANTQPIVDRLPTLLLCSEKNVSRERTSRPSVHTSGCVCFVPAIGERGFYQPGASNPTKVPLAKVNATCGFAPFLTFPRPKTSSLAEGSAWTIPDTDKYCVSLPCKVVGYADVAGREAAKIIAEQELDNQGVKRYTTCKVEELKKLEEELGHRYDAASTLAARLQSVSAEQMTMAFRCVAYVDLKTGLLNRWEFTKTTRGRTGQKDRTQVAILQLT